LEDRGIWNYLALDIAHGPPMIGYLKAKLAKRKLLRTPQEFGHEIRTLAVPGYGDIAYAQWLNPFVYEPWIGEGHLAWFERFISKGDLVVDIGANVGDTAIPMALAAGPNGIVLALEPNPRTFEILAINATLNSDKMHIVPLNCAATERDGDFFYHSSEATFSNGGLSAVDSSEHGRYALEEKVRGITLAAYLRNHHPDALPSLSLIKIDTEGNDREVILTLADIIFEYRPVVMFECFKRVAKAERFGLFEIFDREDYILFNTDAPTVPLRRADMTKWRHFDVVAEPKDRPTAPLSS
jgi:FkbM family methyltransferase